jgi:excisionase family DNA binding protein
MSLMSTGLADEERRATNTSKSSKPARVRPLTITVATACAMSGLGPSKIWGLIREGKLPVTRFGHRTLIHFAEFEALVLEGGGERRQMPPSRHDKVKAAARGANSPEAA